MGISFSLFSLFPFLAFLAVLGIFIAIVASRISEEAKNNKAPVQTVSAKVVSKRSETSGSGGMVDANGMMTGGGVSTQHYVTFEAPDGSRLELPVKGGEFGMLAEGDCGQLTYQRKRYLGFIRQVMPMQTVSDEEVIGRAIAAQMMSDPEILRKMAEQSMPAEAPEEPQQQRMQF